MSGICANILPPSPVGCLLVSLIAFSNMWTLLKFVVGKNFSFLSDFGRNLIYVHIKHSATMCAVGINGNVSRGYLGYHSDGQGHLLHTCMWQAPGQVDPSRALPKLATVFPFFTCGY